ncbi:AMP dependent CoA ligase, putative [Ixodes scapularis]|uniref:AMP dependent CoA ligase, putative n=1 Tax=Ixodes scapularis TaxID=6945 RepID=B7PDU4_IXOSC|nr:AMP dependent CoA ligase, putative [Ixodes scapularis]|eukprot:XP_002399286.1 AMP dependent CoA ligase, putative [Ixodes scapularis]
MLVKVVNAEGKIVPVNTRGELCTRGPHVFKGYLNDDAKTKEAIRDGWYHTGDEGTISEDGRITFVGRIKEMISYKDLNVPPLEVENVLNTHPDVEEAQLPWFMVPECVLFVKSFPRTQTGKVQKHKMREESVRLLTQ